MNWATRRRFVVRSFSGYRGHQHRKPSREWQVFDRAYNFKLISVHRTRQAARDRAAELEEQYG